MNYFNYKTKCPFKICYLYEITVTAKDGADLFNSGVTVYSTNTLAGLQATIKILFALERMVPG